MPMKPSNDITLAWTRESNTKTEQNLIQGRALRAGGIEIRVTQSTEKILGRRASTRNTYLTLSAEQANELRLFLNKTHENAEAEKANETKDEDVRAYVKARGRDEMIRAVKICFNCEEADVDSYGDIWIRYPQAGHWLGYIDRYAFVVWHKSQVLAEG